MGYVDLLNEANYGPIRSTIMAILQVSVTVHDE